MFSPRISHKALVALSVSIVVTGMLMFLNTMQWNQVELVGQSSGGPCGGRGYCDSTKCRQAGGECGENKCGCFTVGEKADECSSSSYKCTKCQVGVGSGICAEGYEIFSNLQITSFEKISGTTAPGELVEYVIVVENPAGTETADADSVYLRVNMSQYFTVKAVDLMMGNTPSSLSGVQGYIYTLGKLSSGESKKVRVTAEVNATASCDQDIQNGAVVGSSYADTTGQANLESEIAQVACADLVISSIVPDIQRPLATGEIVTITVKAKNSGDFEAKNIVLQDVTITNFESTGAAPLQSLIVTSCSGGEGAVNESATCRFDKINPGQSVEMILQGKVTAFSGGVNKCLPIEVAVEINMPFSDKNQTDNKDMIKLKRACLTVSQTLPGVVYADNKNRVGEPVFFETTVVNNSLFDVEDVLIRNSALPFNFDVDQTYDTCWQKNGDYWECELETIKMGKGITKKLKLSALPNQCRKYEYSSAGSNPLLSEGLSLTNTATVRFKEEGTTAATDSDLDIDISNTILKCKESDGYCCRPKSNNAQKSCSEEPSEEDGAECKAGEVWFPTELSCTEAQDTCGQEPELIVTHEEISPVKKSYAIGETINYKITVKNEGIVNFPQGGYGIVQALPVDGIRFESLSSNCKDVPTGDSTAIVCEIKSLAPDSEVTFQATGKIDENALCGENKLRITSYVGQRDSSTSQQAELVETRPILTYDIECSPNLIIEKEIDTTTSSTVVKPGDTVSFHIYYEVEPAPYSTEKVTLKNISITDTFLSKWAEPIGAVGCDTNSKKPGSIECTVKNVESGERDYVATVWRIKDDICSNEINIYSTAEAKIADGTVESNTEDNTDQMPLNLECPGVQLIKGLTQSFLAAINPRQRVIYYVGIQNNESKPIKNVRITELPGIGLEDLKIDCNSVSSKGVSIGNGCSVNVIEPDEFHVFHVHATVASEEVLVSQDLCKKPIINTVSGTYTTEDGEVKDLPVATATFKPDCKPDVQLDVSARSPIAGASFNYPFSYTVNIKNIGAGTAKSPRLLISAGNESVGSMIPDLSVTTLSGKYCGLSTGAGGSVYCNLKDIPSNTRVVPIQVSGSVSYLMCLANELSFYVDAKDDSNTKNNSALASMALDWCPKISPRPDQTPPDTSIPDERDDEFEDLLNESTPNESNDTLDSNITTTTPPPTTPPPTTPPQPPPDTSTSNEADNSFFDWSAQQPIINSDDKLVSNSTKTDDTPHQSAPGESVASSSSTLPTVPAAAGTAAAATVAGASAGYFIFRPKV